MLPSCASCSYAITYLEMLIIKCELAFAAAYMLEFDK
jgi:hypothetical protein